MGAITQEPGTKALRRRQCLARHIQVIEAAIAGGTHDSVRMPGSEPGAPRVTLDPWAVGWIRSERKDPPQLRELLLQCLALLAKGAAGIDRLRSGASAAGNTLLAVQADLMLDSAVGMAVQREIQKAVDDLVRSGNLADARKLAKLQSQLRRIVSELRRSLAESNRGRDEELVEHLTDEAASVSADDLRAVAPAEEPQEPRRARKSAPQRVRDAILQPRRGLRTAILLLAVVVACAVWMAGRALPARTSPKASPLSRDDFPATAPIVELSAPRPSVFVVVDESSWANLDDAQQKRLVDAMGGVLAVHDYWGLLIRTSGGRPVARWLAESGTALIRDTPVQAAPTASAERFDRFVP